MAHYQYNAHTHARESEAEQEPLTSTFCARVWPNSKHRVAAATARASLRAREGPKPAPLQSRTTSPMVLLAVLGLHFSIIHQHSCSVMSVWILEKPRSCQSVFLSKLPATRSVFWFYCMYVLCINLWWARREAQWVTPTSLIVHTSPAYKFATASQLCSYLCI